MNLRQLKSFMVLSEELHFGRAAERLNMSQPPLTRMIQQMEDDLGVLLFERNKRKVILTPIGTEFLQEAKQMVLQMETLKKRLAILGKGEKGNIIVGYVGAVMHTQLPYQLESFVQEYPHIHLQFEEHPNENLLHGLYNGTIDVAFVRTYLNPDGLDEKVLLEEPFVAVLPSNHSLAHKPSILVEELRSENFITFTRTCGPTIYDSFIKICSEAGFTPMISHNASQFNSVLRLVESGFGVSLLPKSTQKSYKLKLKYLKLNKEQETVPLIMLTRKENSNPALQLLKEQF